MIAIGDQESNTSFRNITKDRVFYSTLFLIKELKWFRGSSKELLLNLENLHFRVMSPKTCLSEDFLEWVGCVVKKVEKDIHSSLLRDRRECVCEREGASGCVPECDSGVCA